MSLYTLEYSPSGRAGCRGAEPCKGSKIGKGELRLAEPGYDYGESITNYYRGCTTPAMLRSMASQGVEQVNGFSRLRPEDQQRVRAAVAAGRVDPSDIPPSAKAIDLTTLPESPKKKRPRAESSAPSTSQAGPSTSQAGPSTSQAGPSSSQMQPVASGSGSVSTQYEGEEVEEEDEEEAEEDSLIVVTRSEIVGIKYYKGLVSEGESVRLQREPTNPYDRNAIRAMNFSNVQVGHIPRDVAARLAPLMDRGLVHAEGEMVQGNLYGNPWKLSMDIALFAPEALRAELEPHLRWAKPAPLRRSSKLPLPPPAPSQTGVQGTASPSKGKGKATSATSVAAIAPEPGETPAQTAARQRKMQQVLQALQRVKGDEKHGDEVLDALSDAKDVLELPFPKSAPGIISGDLNVDLLNHQLQGLRWMRRAEAPKLPQRVEDPPVQLIKMQTRSGGQGSYWLNLASKQPTSEQPKLARGGMLCDAMGLGKTLQCLALIVDTLEQHPAGFEKGTLIVCPVSVISNWSTQIKDHISASLGVTSHIYHGDGRNISVAKLRKFDIVITAYPTVSGEFADESKIKKKKKKVQDDSVEEWDDEPSTKRKKNAHGKLFQVALKRIILDEGHTIKNSKARISRAACALNAYARWVCTATPIINSPSDLGSLLTFLRSCAPLDDPELFKRLLLRPLAAGDVSGIKLLKAVMSSISLRRTKEMSKDGKPLVALPPISFFIVSVPLETSERASYDEVAAASQRLVKAYLEGAAGAAGAAGAPSFANVLSLLTRMRQLCLHEDLVPSGYLESLKTKPAAGAHDASALQMSTEDMAVVQKALQQAVVDAEECGVCFDTLLAENIRGLPCRHVFHLACLDEILKTAPLCPMDRRPITAASLIEYKPPAEDEEEQERKEQMATATATKSSAKITKLVELLRLCDPDSKSLVFSQFTRFLDLIEVQLKEAGITFCRFDGSMAQKKREAIIKSFSKTIDLKSSNPSPQVMLISLKAGALGLNLTCASQVFLMDPWWQASIEAQAVDRVYRIGQTRPVKVFQLVAKDTVEDKVLEIQTRKEQIISQAFSGTKNATGTTAKQKKQSRIEDLRELFA